MQLVEENVLCWSHINDPATVLPPARTLKLDVQDAARFRDFVDGRCPTRVCGVCSLYCGPAHINTYDISLLPHLALLAADGRRTSELPRHAHTSMEYPAGSSRKYCIQPAACTQDDAGVVNLDVCHICYKCLQRKAVPPASLVRFDAGCIPRALCPEDQLVPLRMVEEQLVAQIHVARLCIIMRPVKGGRTRGTDTMQMAQRGHVIAFPNVDIKLVHRALPLPIEDIPDLIQVIFVCKATSPEEVRQLARKARCLSVRGKEVAKWARFLYEVGGCY